jgi:hypothetical protein
MQIRSRAWLGGLFVLCACSSNDSSTTAPPPKVTLSIAALLPRNDDVWYPGDTTPAVVGCDRRLGVTLEVENFYLRAPAACGGAVQCGYVEVSLLHAADASLAAGPIAGAGTGLVLDLSALEPVDGDYLVHPELRTTAGTLYERNYLEPPVDVSVTLASDACDSADGDAGGAGNGDGVPGAAGVTGG